MIAGAATADRFYMHREGGSWRELYHSGNFNPGNYLPLAGGTMIGGIKMSYAYQSGANFKFINNRAVSGGGGWADSVLNIYTAAESSIASIGICGNADALSYLYIGSDGYNGVNLRINSSSIKWGDNDILHAGNFVAGTNYVAPATTLAGYGITDWLVTSTGTALDSLTTAGVYRLSTQTSPYGSYGNLLVVRNGSASDTLAQVYFPYNADAVFFRRGTTSNFTSNAWQQLYHTGNLTQSVVLDLIGSGTVTNAMLAGSISDSKLSTKYMIIRNGQDIDFNMADNAYRSSVWYVHSSYTQSNKPATYGVVADFNYDAGHLQIASDNSNKYYIRGCWWTAGGGTWDSWRTIYHSGNSNKSDVNWSAATLTADYAHLGSGNES